MGFLLVVGWSGAGCVSTTKQKLTSKSQKRTKYRYQRRRTARRSRTKSTRYVWPHMRGQARSPNWGTYERRGYIAKRREDPREGQTMPQHVQPKRVYRKESLRDMFVRYGEYVLKLGDYHRKRSLYLHNACNKFNASPALCGMYKRSQRLFSINYAAPKSKYRGYFAFHRRRKRRIPRPMMRWYTKVWKEKYKSPQGQCHLEKGFVSNCMSFAMCAQKDALANFQGQWGRGFQTPTWGLVNYWSTRAFYRLSRRYRSGGSWRPGTLQVVRDFSKWGKRKRKRVARRLVKDMKIEFNKLARRRGHGYWSRRLFDKAFCSNIVVNMNSYDRSLPGDMFTLATLSKRRRRISLGFNHWGLVTDSMRGEVLHNQTPGGMWRRQFERWGIQYGLYPPSKLTGRWKYDRRRRRYRRKMFFVNRLNVHYYQYARKRGVDIYDTKNRSLCDDYIRDHAEIFFTELIPGVSAPQNQPSSLVSLLQSGPQLLEANSSNF